MLPVDNTNNVDPYPLRNLQQHSRGKMVRVPAPRCREEGGRWTKGLNHSLPNKDYSKNRRGAGNG
jgi:hypothetical protein